MYVVLVCCDEQDAGVCETSCSPSIVTLTRRSIEVVCEAVSMQVQATVEDSKHSPNTVLNGAVNNVDLFP